MPFWGSSNARKEAEGWPREFGAWGKDQMQRFLEMASRYGAQGMGIDEETLNHWRQRLASGMESPEAMRSRGQEISPWVQDFINNSRERQNSIWDMEASRVPASETAGTMRGRLETMRGRNSGNLLDLETEIGDTSQRQMGREEEGFNETVRNLQDTSSSLRGIIGDTYGGARRTNADTFDALSREGDTAFSNQRRNLELIRPGGQAQTARVGRSFAGQTADTMQRLRRAGIDPNSPEAASLLRNVETDRSRAMDDANADSIRDFVSGSRAVSLDELGFRSGVARDRLGNEINLGVRQGERTADITGSEGDEFRRRRTALTGNLNDIDAVRSGRRAEAVDTAAQREQALNSRDLDIDTWERDADMQDRDRRTDILNAFNSNDLVSGGLLDNQYQQGYGWGMANRGVQDEAMRNITGVGNRATDNMFRANQSGQGWGNSAMGAYNQAYGYEQPWGPRVLGGLAGAAANYFLPGSGGFVSGAVNPSSQQGGGAPGGQFGSGWGGSTNPYAFSMNPQGQQPGQPNFQSQIAQMAAMFRQPRREYDPARTRTLPNGDLMVGQRR